MQLFASSQPFQGERAKIIAENVPDGAMGTEFRNICPAPMAILLN
jgi:hypothetical protein